MSKVLLALTSAALLGLSGCAEMEPSQPPAKPAEAKPTISAEAQAALTAAQADVKAAQAKNALWTNSKDALGKAEKAAEAGNSAEVLKETEVTEFYLRKAAAQLNYPTLKTGD
jgi:type IV pilus biogenesis protein CpaD/CtpE